MKKALITILLLIATITQAQTFKINTNVPAQFGKYPTLTNSSEIVLSGDTIRAGGLSINLMYILNSINDTNFSINKSQPELFGQRSQVTNNNSLIFGSDTAYSNSISASLIYLLNNNIATTDVSHTFTATQYFNKIFVDTLIANNIDSVHSTYWYSNSGDTIGYIDAATEKVAFFKKMTIGDLQTNTTVAENFIRSNQVQTDTIYPHSPLFLAGDTTIAKKIFADTVTAIKLVVKGNSQYNLSLIGNSPQMKISENETSYVTVGVDKGQLKFVPTGTNASVSFNRTMYVSGGQYGGLFVSTDPDYFGMNLVSNINKIYTTGNHTDIYIMPNNIPAMIFKTNGDVGIGTTSPSVKLDVNGAIKSTTATFTTMPVYTDNADALAGGLTAGQIYKTSTGTLMIVY